MLRFFLVDSFQIPAFVDTVGIPALADSVEVPTLADTIEIPTIDETDELMIFILHLTLLKWLLFVKLCIFGLARTLTQGLSHVGLNQRTHSRIVLAKFDIQQSDRGRGD